MAGLTHFDDKGAAHMVDVSEKAVTARVAVAKGNILMAAETRTMIQEGRARKGDVLSVARLAGIMGAKKTPDLIPLCHPLTITKVSVDLSYTNDGLEVGSFIRCQLPRDVNFRLVSNRKGVRGIF